MNRTRTGRTTSRLAACMLLLFATCGPLLGAESCPAGQHPTFSVSLAPEFAGQVFSGRLLVLMSNQPGPQARLAPSFGPDAHSVWLAAKQVHGVTPQTPVDLDPDDLAYPAAFCTAPAGQYHLKAILDVNHDFAYSSDASDGDLLSSVEERSFDPASGDRIALTLTERKADPPLQLPAHTEPLDFVSPTLTAFWGRPIYIRGVVVLPPGYNAGHNRYPTVYWNHGFGAGMSYVARMAGNVKALMEQKKAPEMIWVMLLEAFPTGTHEFADSVNNGPWGTALVTDLIPFLEKKYRMDAKPRGRFLTGHSSGGWASLWIQVSHPDFFGGAWPTAPDPGDFRNFVAGLDLTKTPPQNFYRNEDGTLRMFIRVGGKDTQTLQDLTLQEHVMGDYGGQLASFEWVFSPRGKDGRPMPLFDRDTGVVDPEVAAYWEEHYDVAHLLRANWGKIGPLLNGKIHLTVGTADTFHLDEPARLLDQTIKDLGGKASFSYVEGRTHFDLYQGGLTEKIAKEMYAVARPGSRFAVATETTPPISPASAGQE